MRILYVVEQIEESFGCSIINRRNLDLLNRLGCDVELYKVVPRRLSLHRRLREIVTDYRVYGGLTIGIIKEIEKKVAVDSFDAVFITYSRYGALVRKLKKRFPELKLVTFFHNIEVIYAYQETCIQHNKLRACASALLTYVAEKASVKYSDTIIVLNQRDASFLKKIYHRNVDVILPTSFEDEGENCEKRMIHAPLRYLFVGSAFFANIQGINWFIEHVLPFVSGELYVVGRGMSEVLREGRPQDRLRVVGEVDNVKDWYKQADIVVCPIFLGSGMKTKTAEAMMYGKPIVGTREAFVGYDVDPEKIGGCFDDARGMIDSLNRFEKNPERLEMSGQYARTMFVEKYSFASSLDIMRRVFDND